MRTRGGTHPWGRGRPGWHIECSAMAEKLLGPVFEIHGGGLDLVFPHHENELAQSSARGHEFARVWMHNGMLRMTGEKMSKSVGNIASMQEVLDEWGRETALVYYLTGHWRSPIDFSDERMAEAAARVDGFREVFRNASRAGQRRRVEPVRVGPRGRLQHARGPRRHARVARPRPAASRARRLRPRGARRRRRGSGRAWRSWRDAGRRHEPGATSRRRTACGEEIEAAGWEVRDDPGGFRLVPRS